MKSKLERPRSAGRSRSKRLRVAVLMGGTSAEREVSLSSGQEVVKALKKLGKYQIKIYDPKTDLFKLIREARKIDVVLPLLHGPAGEDGKIQGLLEVLGLPYGFSGVLPSALAMDKLRQRLIYEKIGLPVPKYQALSSLTLSSPLPFKFPVVVKPNTQGSSVGISICQNKKQFQSALKKAFQYDEIILVEEYLKGKEVTVGVLGQGEEAIALPVVEIVPKRPFFDYQAKYDGTTAEIVPAPLPLKLSRQAQQFALLVHQTLGCSGVTRTDMILAKSKIYVLEINTIPGFTKESLIPKAALAAGISFEELVERLIEFAFKK